MAKGSSLQDLILGYRFEETYELGEHKILMQTLSAREKQEILQSVAGLDMTAQFQAIRVPTLARAIVSIDGKIWDMFSEIRNAKTEQKGLIACIEEFLLAQSDASIRLLYDLYLSLEAKHDAELQKALKKGELVNPIQGPSGESVESSDVAQKKSEI